MPRRALPPLIAGLCLAGLATVFFLPFLLQPGQLLWPASGLGSDLSYINWPLQTFYNTELQARGSLPLWDSRFMLGKPLIGDPHILWGYPLNLLLLWLPPILVFNLFSVFHVALAGVGLFALLRRGFRTSRRAALLGALAFMFMPKFMAQAIGVLAFGLAWVPLVWLGVRLAAKEHHALAGAWGGACLALLTPLHVQITYYAGATAVAYYLWLFGADLIAGWRAAGRLPWPSLARSLTAFGCFLLSFGLLAAPTWLPLLELMPYTSRQTFTLADASFYQLPLPLLATLLAPTQFQFPEWITYLGLVPLVLAGAAWVGPRRADATFFAALTLFALVYGLGTQTPLFGLVFALVPGADFFRVPTRLWAFAGLALAVVAGLGVDALLSPAVAAFARRRAAWLRRLAAAYLFGLGAALLGGTWLAGRFQGQILVVLLVALGLLALVWACRRGWLQRPALFPALCLVLLADLMPLASTFFTLEHPARSFLATSPALDYIAAQPGLFRVYSTHRELNYAAAAERGVETLDGALSFQLAHAVDIIKAATGCELAGFATGVPPCLTGEIDPEAYRRAQPRAALLGLLNVKYVVSGFPLADTGLQPVMEAEGLTVYANTKWLPRGFVVSRVEAVPDHAAALAAVRDADPTQVAYLVDRPAVTAAAAYQPAAVVDRRPGYYQVEVSGPGLLVFSESWAPGWQAHLDQRRVPVYRTNAALLGVALPAGAHTVTLEYSPLGWRIGAPLCGLGWLGLAAGTFARLPARRANRGRMEQPSELKKHRQ